MIQWGWAITGQRIMGQSCSDWLKVTSSRTSKPNTGVLSRFLTMKIGRNDQLNQYCQDIYLRYLKTIYFIF